jgi:flagellar biosynthesis anti-sigma factor FlgM
MRINLDHATQPLPESTRAAAQNSPAAGSSATKPLGQDQTQLGGGHAQVQALAAQALQLPEVRAERVDALRQVVQSGRYQASPGAVAGAVFSHMLVERQA